MAQMWRPLACPLVAIVAALGAAACTNGGGGGTSEPTREASPTATAAATPSAPTPVSKLITPPLEGPDRSLPFSERTNYLELPEYQLPQPEDVPAPPSDATGAEFHPPAEPSCPEGWQTLQRPVEGFTVCYPEPLRIDGHGYVSSGFDDRWYSVGLFLFDGERQLAHVSIYILNPYALPFPYTRDCPHPYRVTFAGSPSVLCTDFPPRSPEGEIITYYLRRDDFDYYINIVPYLEYDEAAGDYLDTWPDDILQQAIKVAQTFQLTPRIELGG